MSADIDYELNIVRQILGHIDDLGDWNAAQRVLAYVQARVQGQWEAEYRERESASVPPPMPQGRAH